MRVVDVTNADLDFMNKFIRNYVPSTNGQEMICAALTHDTDLEVKVALDERGIAAAVSYTTYRDRVHVFSLGSIVKGAGSLLMASVELLPRHWACLSPQPLWPLPRASTPSEAISGCAGRKPGAS